MKQIRILLIDPFQKKVHQLYVPKGIQHWYKLCDCHCFDHAYIGQHCGVRHDIFVDDEGLLKENPPPGFKWRDYVNPLMGYGVLTACDNLGETIDTPMPVEYALSCIDWEQWELRLKPEDYFDQLSRLYFPEPLQPE